jgi:hypothetical protein
VRYGFTDKDFTDAIVAAFNDYESALICYRAIYLEKQQ